MKLGRVAKFFDRDKVYDGYSADYLFNAQFATYEGNTPDGGFLRRRTISMAPDLSPPAHRVVSCYGERWIVGDTILDGFDFEAIRKTASAKLVTDEFQILSPRQAAQHALVGERFAYGQAEFLKATVNTPMDSEYDPQYVAAFGVNEYIPKNYFLRSDRFILSVRMVEHSVEGFTQATVDQIGWIQDGVWEENPQITVELEGTINPITELPAPGATVSGLVLDMYKLYQYKTDADPLSKPGDRTLLLADRVANGRQMKFAGERWQAITVQPLHDAFMVHIRRQ